MPEKKKKRPAKKTNGKKAAARRKKTNHSRRNRRSKRCWWAWPVTIVMIAALLGMGVLVARERMNYRDFKQMRETVDTDGFYEGITIDGVSVAGHTYQEVLASLASREQQRKDQCSVTLAYGSKSWNIVADDLDYQADYAEVVAQAYQIGHTGSVQNRYQQIRETQQRGAAFTTARDFDESLLRMITDEVAASISYEARNASVESFDVSSRTFSFVQEKNGLYVDAEQLYQSALSALRSGVGGTTVAVSAQPIIPEVTYHQLESSCGLVDSAKTRLYDSSRGRVNNIQLALDTITGVRVDPGVTFSFNDTVGQRTAERGYKEAGAFSDGMAVQELGGGICQVSTTLFNAVVKSDLSITTRNPHSRPVSYVDKGKDAAVSWPNQDFKFTNSSDVPVYIVGELTKEGDKRYVTISIYGRQLPNGEYIRIQAQQLGEIEPGKDEYRYTNDLPTGVTERIIEARVGYRAVAYKIRYNADGEEISNEVLCNSTYPASGNVYNVGR